MLADGFGFDSIIRISFCNQKWLINLSRPLLFIGNCFANQGLPKRRKV